MSNIRPAVTTDIDVLSRYDKHISRAELQNAIGLGRIYIQENHRQFCGWLRYNLFWDNTPFMNLLFILEEERHKGFGKEMVLHWEKQMKELGYEVVMTSTQENEDAKYFYKNLGYTKIGGFYPVGDGYEIILAKQI